MNDPDPLRFPYMVFAKTESHGSPRTLSQSGMPPADPSFAPGFTAEDLAFADQAALPAVRERLAARFEVPPERVLVTVGTSGAMHVCALRWFRPGARVAAEIPSYEPLRALPAHLGADVRLVRRRPEAGWTLEPEDVRRALAGGSGPGHVFATNLHNPSGAFLPAERVRALAEEAARAGGVLVSNEVYMEYVPRAERVHAYRLAPNAVSLGSLTKAYGLGALRLGWVVLGEGLADELAHLADMSYLAYVDPPTPSLRMACTALDHLDRLRGAIERCERRCRPHVERWLAETEDVEGLLPRHGVILFPRVRGVDDTRALHDSLRGEVDVVPGEHFGAPGHLRIGFGTSEEKVVAGLEALTRGLRAFTARAR